MTILLSLTSSIMYGYFAAFRKGDLHDHFNDSS